jgi:PAS domain S-box-containing protein
VPLPPELVDPVELRAFDEEGGLRQLVDALPIGVFVREGVTCRYANQYASIAIGFGAPEAMVGTNMLDLVRPDQRAAMLERLTAVDAGAQQGTTDAVIVGRDGIERTIQLFDPRRVTFGGAPATLVVCRDVTHERQLERRLFEVEQRTMLTRLSGGLAHEINNPLSVILYALGSLSDDADDDQLAHDALAAAQRIARVVRDVQLLSRTQEDSESVTDVRDAADHAVHIAGDELRYRATVVRHYGSPLPVRAPEPTLARAILAVLLHAVARLPAGHAGDHRVTIEIDSAPAETGRGSTRLVITDTGAPVSAEDLEASFEPFTSTTSVALKTGLGLAVCRQIFESLGGSIQARPLAPCGVRFEATLPAIPEHAETRVPTPAPSSVRQRLRILVVDDDPMLRTIVSRMLSDHDLATCESGKAALDELAQRTDYDVVLTDVMMPDMGGTALYRHLLEHHPGLADRVVFMTGGAFSADDRRILDPLPSSRVIAKPFRRRDLMTAIERATGRRRAAV